MKKILDNGHIMHYNNHCSAGVAHLVERDLAKVEVASSSLVARSKKKHHPTGWCFFAFTDRAEARTGHERSERNMPGACFGARVRVAARLGRQRASSPAPKRNTIRQGGVFLHLPTGQRLEQGTSEARETCRGHVLVPACVWRPGWAASEPRRPLQKETPSFRMVFLFGMLRAGPNSLPRPARSALNQEVRQGSCEWLRHSWDAGSESSLVTFFAFAVCGDADNKSSGQS